MASLLLPPLYQTTDNSGRIASGALLYVYNSGTTTLANTYSDIGMTTASTVNSDGAIVADSSGRFPNIYVAGGQNYKIILQTSAGAEILSRDILPPAISNGSGSLPISSGGTGATTASAARMALGAASSTNVSNLSTDVADVKGQVDAVGGVLRGLAARDDVRFEEITGLSVTLQRKVITAQPNATMTDTDGTEFVSTTFTPKRSTSQIVINVVGAIHTGSTAGDITVGIFRSGTSTALMAHGNRPNSTGPFSLTAITSSTNTSEATFSVRATGSLRDVTMEITEYEAAP